MRDIDLSVWELDRALMDRVDASHISLGVDYVLANVMNPLTSADNVVHCVNEILCNIHYTWDIAI